MIKRSLAALAMIATYSSGQALSTLNMANGRAWNAMSSDDKMLYLRAGWDVVRLLMLDLPKPRPTAVEGLIEDLSPEPLTGPEVIQELDIFYKEPANLPVPVVMALGWVTKKAYGASRRELDELEASLRGIATKIPK
jgi:hypothetical protein